MTSVAGVLKKKHDGERTKWNMKSFLLSEFGEYVCKIGKEGLFRDAFDSIHPIIWQPDEVGAEPSAPE